ncbi:Type IV secretion-system coupling protein DNA-binding domain protein [Candidatus Anstonella stagnisolia]|nr:Type IV secretion-system coupling protein DNA-binding domain protein [Candidatus Anstonella stagnisolia]
MGGKISVREVLLYTVNIKAGDVLNFFNQLTKTRLPLFGFIDFSDIFSTNPLNIYIERKLNTVHFYIKDRKGMEETSMLVFPYKLSDPLEIERKKGSLFPIPKFYALMGSQDFLSFALKEKMEDVHLRVIKMLGKYWGYGSAIDEFGRKSIILSTTPERFMIVDMEQNPSVYVEVLEPIPKRMSLSSQFPVFEETGMTLGVDNFDFFQHTLIVGASGTGKSKALYAMLKAIEAKQKDDVRFVIIDPHGEFLKVFPNEKIVNLIDNYIEPLDVGGVKTPLMTQLIAQLLSSAIGQENKYSERVLFYAVHLLSAIDKMDLRNVSLLLTDSSKRAEFVSQTNNDEVKRFFDEEFNDIYIHHFNDAVLPILNFVGEYELYLGGDKKQENLYDLVKNNRITVVSFNPNFFGKRMINFLAGAIINQMYILAITEKLDKPTILVMDEFQRVETRVVRDILAETRKFNLYAYLSMQYLGQLSKEVHDSIISNIRNIIAFKLNRQDATMISSIMEIKVEEYFKKARSQTEIEESKKEMFVRLHQRECMVRLYDGKKYILPMKLKVVDVARWGYSESSVTSQQLAEKYEKAMAARDKVKKPETETGGMHGAGSSEAETTMHTENESEMHTGHEESHESIMHTEKDSESQEEKPESQAEEKPSWMDFKLEEDLRKLEGEETKPHKRKRRAVHEEAEEPIAPEEEKPSEDEFSQSSQEEKEESTEEKTEESASEESAHEENEQSSEEKPFGENEFSLTQEEETPAEEEKPARSSLLEQIDAIKKKQASAPKAKKSAKKPLAKAKKKK